MPVRGVIGDEVEDEAKPAPMHLCDQPIEVGHGAEEAIDRAIVRDVISEIGHGRRVNGRNPDRIHTELHEIIETIVNAGKIADAVTVTVLKRPRINLVDYRLLPPLQIVHQTL